MKSFTEKSTLSFQYGISLIEILIALSISSILLMISLSSLSNFYQHSKADHLRLTLIRTLQFAAQEAKLLDVPVTLCKTSNQSSCFGEWINGVMMFVDEAENGQVEAQEKIISIVQMPNVSGQLHWRAFPKYRDYVLFSPKIGASQDNGTFWYCEKQTALPTWAVVLNRMGQLRTVYPDRNGVILDSQGKSLSCAVD